MYRMIMFSINVQYNEDDALSERRLHILFLLSYFPVVMLSHE